MENTDPPGAALAVVRWNLRTLHHILCRQLGLETCLPASVLALLEQEESKPGPEVFARVTNMIIGNNEIILERLVREARQVRSILSSE